jgi:hypothetical protein
MSAMRSTSTDPGHALNFAQCHEPLQMHSYWFAMRLSTSDAPAT